MQLVVAVDPDSASLERLGHAQRLRAILREHGGGETVDSVVRHADDIVLVSELGDYDDGAEDLLSHDGHAGLDVGENRWLQSSMACLWRVARQTWMK